MELQTEQSSAALVVEHVSKTFGAQQALDDVTLEIASGEIHGLVGQNGSGKSTLIKLLSGFHRPDHGSSMILGGHRSELGERHSSIRAVHQDLALVPSLSVRENLSLDQGGLLGRIPSKRDRARALELLSIFDVEIDPDTLISQLSPYHRSLVAVARALGGTTESVDLLILDEPTAALGAHEKDLLFAALRRVHARGVAMLYVSHFLDEVLEMAERVTVLRDGRVVARHEVASLSHSELVRSIVGTNLDEVTRPPFPSDTDKPAIEVRSLCAGAIEDASFVVRTGEVLGLTGLAGSGFEDIARSLSGITPMDGGEILLAGRTVSTIQPRDLPALRIAAVPSDRRGQGVIGGATVAENVTLPTPSAGWNRWRLDAKKQRADVRHWIDMAGVKPADPEKRVSELSGGNQQKVLIARALRLRPEILVLADPTQAVDIGAAAAIRALISEVAMAGRAVIVASSDPEELQQLCHRVLITRGGRVEGVLSGPEITEERIVHESQFEGVAV